MKCLLMMVVSLLLVLNFSIEVSASTNYDRQEADACITISQRLSVKGGSRTSPNYYITESGTVLNAKNTYLTSLYDRPQVEIKSGKSVRPQNTLDDWNEFLGENQTDINPFTGQQSLDRIWSADGKRSIRFGDHEMDSMGTRNFHYHKETWFDDYVLNELQRVQMR